MKNYQYVDRNPFEFAIEKLIEHVQQVDKLEAVRLAYVNMYEEFKLAARPQPYRRVSFEAAVILANSLLTSQALQCVSYICVSDYVGGKRYQMQGGTYTLTHGEVLMFERVSRLSSVAREVSVDLRWQLILADGWGLELYGDRIADGALDQYCVFMRCECEKRGLEAIRWSELMARYRAVYDEEFRKILPKAGELAKWEATRGEIAHDKPDKECALELAISHISMRATEGIVVVHDRGPTLVLSTEGRGTTRYDNLLVPRSDYTHLYIMPHYPHRLP